MHKYLIYIFTKSAFLYLETYATFLEPLAFYLNWEGLLIYSFICLWWLLESASSRLIFVLIGCSYSALRGKSKPVLSNSLCIGLIVCYCICRTCYLGFRFLQCSWWALINLFFQSCITKSSPLFFRPFFIPWLDLFTFRALYDRLSYDVFLHWCCAAYTRWCKGVILLFYI
jgi:hypothetical protein